MVGPYTNHNAYRASINDSGTVIFILAVSSAPIPVLAQTPVPTETFAPAQTLTPTLAPIPAFASG